MDEDQQIDVIAGVNPTGVSIGHISFRRPANFSWIGIWAEDAHLIPRPGDVLGKCDPAAWTLADHFADRGADRIVSAAVNDSHDCRADDRKTYYSHVQEPGQLGSG